MPSTEILTRARLYAILCLFGGAVAFQVYLFGFRAPARVIARGPHLVTLNEFGHGATVSQTFVATADGLEEIRILLWAPKPMSADIGWTLSMDRDAMAVNPTTGRLSVQLSDGWQWRTIRFRPLPASANRLYRLDLWQIPRTAANGLALGASLDDALASGCALVNQHQRWGDLWFEARAIGDTQAGQFLELTLPSLKPPLNNAAIWVVLLVFGDMLFAVFLATYPSPRVRAVPQATWRAARVSPFGLTALAVLVAALITTIALAPSRHQSIDLISEIYRATLASRDPLHSAFAVGQSWLAGDGRQAIDAHPPSTITWSIAVPAASRLRTALGIEQGAWPLSKDGVVFRILVNDGRESEVLMRHVDPLHVPDDRRWIPVDVDLSPWAGRTVSLVFRTEPSLPGAVVDSEYDWAMWGAPQIVSSSR